MTDFERHTKVFRAAGRKSGKKQHYVITRKKSVITYTRREGPESLKLRFQRRFRGKCVVAPASEIKIDAPRNRPSASEGHAQKGKMASLMPSNLAGAPLLGATQIAGNKSSRPSVRHQRCHPSRWAGHPLARMRSAVVAGQVCAEFGHQGYKTREAGFDRAGIIDRNRLLRCHTQTHEAHGDAVIQMRFTRPATGDIA